MNSRGTATGMLRLWRGQALDLGVGVMTGASALAAGLSTHRLMVDDAYITYSFARNLARTGVLAYSAGSSVLSTTAPLYAMLLGAVARLGIDIPSFSNTLGAASLLGAAWLLYGLCRRHQAPLAGAAAALLLVTSPLLWLNLGMETDLCILLVCGAFYCFDRGHWVVTAALLAMAMMARADGLIAAAIIAFDYVVLMRRPIRWKPVAVFLGLMAPMTLYLFFRFGSPAPVTLAAKRAQVQLGITGFYAGTTLFEGLLIMLRGWGSQSVLYGFALPLLLGGVAVLRRYRWAWGIVAWGVLYYLAYTVLNVTPYLWYYGPLAPAGALLAGLAGQWLADRVRRPWLGVLLSAAPVLGLALAQAASLHGIASALDSASPAAPAVQAKVLPGQNGYLYRDIGRWLNEHTKPGSLIAVTDVGIIGYYADRPMVDFLGVLQPDVAEALSRRDLRYAILHYMPDYVVLGSDLGTFGIKFADDQWFLANYHPVQSIRDYRSPDSSQVILERVTSPGPLREYTAGDEIAPGLVLQSFAIDSAQPQSAAGLRVRIDWLKTRPLGDLQARISVDDPHGAPVAWEDRTIDPSLWARGQAVSTHFAILVPRSVRPGSYTIALHMDLGEQKNVTHALSPLSVGAEFSPPPVQHPLDVAFGEVARLRGYSIERPEVKPGQPLQLTLYWQAINDLPLPTSYTVFARLVDAQNQTVAQHDGMPAAGSWPTTAWAKGQIVVDSHELNLEGAYTGPAWLKVGLYDLATMNRLTTGSGDSEVTLPSDIAVRPQ